MPTSEVSSSPVNLSSRSLTPSHQYGSEDLVREASSVSRLQTSLISSTPLQFYSSPRASSTRIDRVSLVRVRLLWASVQCQLCSRFLLHVTQSYHAGANMQRTYQASTIQVPTVRSYTAQNTTPEYVHDLMLTKTVDRPVFVEKPVIVEVEKLVYQVNPVCSVRAPSIAIYAPAINT